MKMSVMTVSMAAFRSDPDQVLSTVAYVGGAGSRLALKLDPSALGKRIVEGRPIGARALEILPVSHLQDLLRLEADEYMPDEEAIARLVGPIASHQLLTIDACAFKLDVLVAVLHHMRRMLFSASDWPGSIAVIVRDEVLDRATDSLVKSFYLPPLRTSVREAAGYAYRLHRIASSARIFGWSAAFTERAFAFHDRLARRWSKLTGQDEVDLT